MPYRGLMRAFMAGALLLLLGSALTACNTTAPQEAVPEVESFTVRLYNSNPLDVTVYALYNGSRYRLGQLGTTQTERFTLPPDLVVVSPLIRLEADPIGSAVIIFIDEFVVVPGEEIALTVPSYNRQ